MTVPAIKLYLSGPIKGQLCAEANFNHAEDQLSAAGFGIVNPFACPAICRAVGVATCIDSTTDAHYDHMMRGDLAAMLACDGVALLNGWQASRGARLEHSVALLVGIPAMSIGEWLA